MTAKYNFTIEKGATFNPKLLYSQPTFNVVPITAITKSGRASVTADSHGLTQDWSVYVVGVVGMDRINHKSEELEIPAKAYLARYVDGDTLRLEVDTTRFESYVSGGELLYRPPMDLTGYTARMHIRETVDATTALATMTTANGKITLGGTAGTIELLLTDTETTAFTVANAVYDLEVIDGFNRVTRLLEGSIAFSEEVTR